MRIFFDRELDNVATFWRIFRRDGVMLAFTSHDRDLAFGGINHRAAPGMVPAAIRLSAALANDSAEAEGALSHSSISEIDLASGLFDDAAIEIGAVDWQTLEHEILYSGQMGAIEDDQTHFSAELRSEKVLLEQDLVPRTSPTCRAEFCGHGCGLSATRFTGMHSLIGLDLDRNRLRVDGLAGAEHVDGTLRFLSGPQTGLRFGIVGIETDVDGNWLILDRPLAPGTALGTRAELREGCDHTIVTCSDRFANARNFRGEPFLPGNDLLSRYGRS